MSKILPKDDAIELAPEDNTNGTELSPFAPLPSAVEPYNPFGEAKKCWANFKLEERFHKVLAMRMRQGETKKADDLIGQVFSITHVMIHPVSMVDEVSGLVTDCHRTIIRTTDDELVGFVSEGIIKSIGMICMLEGNGPWEEGVKVRLKQHQLKKARRTFSLELVNDDQPEAPKKKGK